MHFHWLNTIREWRERNQRFPTMFSRVEECRYNDSVTQWKSSLRRPEWTLFSMILLPRCYVSLLSFRFQRRKFYCGTNELTSRVIYVLEYSLLSLVVDSMNNPDSIKIVQLMILSDLNEFHHFPNSQKHTSRGWSGRKRGKS